MTPQAFAADRVLDAAADGILCIDLDGRVAYANPAALRLLGYAAADELLGLTVWSHMQFLERASGTDACWRADGTSFPVDYEIAPLEGAGSVVTFRDVTARRAAERTKDELISVVSHELRTPLTSIRSALGLLAGNVVGPLPNAAQRMMQIAVTNADRLIRLVNDTLDLERVESGNVRLAIEACDVSELMTEAADGVRALADDAGVMVNVAPSQVEVAGDFDRLIQVFTNLLANGIKFSPRGGTVSLDVEDADGEVVFRVRDEGRGIPPAKLETIFERFAQVDDSDAREKGGTGLGLAICRAIVEQHGGQIWAESTVGLGTTICVALPTSVADEVSRQAAA